MRLSLPALALGAGCSPTRVSEPLPGPGVVFLTSEATVGDLGGLPGADDRCQAAASEAGLDGRFAAWLSAGQIRAADRVSGLSTWFDTVDMRVFSSESSVEEGPLRTLSHDASGDSVADGTLVWTGTRDGGTPAPLLNCEGWTSGLDIPHARVGVVDSGDPDVWTDYTTIACNQEAHLLCFEVPIPRDPIGL